MDDLDFEPTAPVRVAGRFRPKTKPKSMKVASTVAASDLPNVAAESSILGTDTETVLSATSIDAGVVKVKEPVGSSSATSEIERILEPSENNQRVCSSVSSLDGDRGTNPSESAIADTLQQSVVDFNGSDGGADSVFRNTAGQNPEIFSGSDCLDNLPTQSTVPASRSPEKVNEGKCGAMPHCSVESSAILASETQTDYCATQCLMSCTIASLSNEHGDIQLETKVDASFSEFEVLDDVSEAPILTGSRAGKLQPKLRVKKGQENLNIPHSEIEFPSLSEAADFETGDMDESSSPTFLARDGCDPVSPASGDSITPNPTPDFQVNAESHVESTLLDGPIGGDAPHSDSVCGRGRENGNVKASTPSNPQKRKAADKEAKGGTSSKKSRKQSPSQQIEGPRQKTNEEGLIAANSSDSHGNEGTEHNEIQRKRAPRKSKSAVSENENPVQKRKRTKKAPDESNEVTTKKKFSHSTRKNRRSVDKSLLEIPDEDFDHQKYPLKDLIRRNEHIERLAIKEAAKSKTPVANERSSYNDFDIEASRNEEENFGLGQERGSDDDQSGHIDRASTCSSIIFNYQTYMNKAPVARWSKQDTELFYEALAQFGPDFNMMAKLFPNRTRHQIKLKFKKEDRQNPLLISEAFRRRSKDNSKYILVINELQKQKQESNANDVTCEDVEPTHENDEGATKLESDEIQDTGTEVADEVPHEEAAAAEVHSPVKSDQSDDDNTFGGWDDDF